MKPLRIFVFLAAIWSTAPSFAQDGQTPAGVAHGFYVVYSTFHPSDGIPDAAGRAKYSPFLSPAFERLLAEAAAAEARFGKANKGAPPLLEGDLFTSLFRRCDRFSYRCLQRRICTGKLCRRFDL
jgi:hypothetical protein